MELSGVLAYNRAIGNANVLTHGYKPQGPYHDETNLA
jgi:hypothetical protein